MGWFANAGNSGALERYVPVSPAKTYEAVLKAVENNYTFKLKSADNFTMTVNFSSGASAFTWGENFTAQVVPAEGGSTVRVQGVGKVGGQLQQGARLHKLINNLFDDVVSDLRPA
jgi:carbon monoxide dehydrogenase subunit G